MDNPKDVREYKEFLFSETRTALSYTRTMMSADRTLLSFSTAGLSLIAGGIGLVGATDFVVLRTTGYMLIPCGLLVWIRGIFQYTHSRRLLKKVGRFLETQGLYIPGAFIGGVSKKLAFGEHRADIEPPHQK